MLSRIKQLGKESLIYGGAGMLNKFIAVFLVPLYTHLFTQQQYGLQGLVVTVITLAAILSVMGMDSTVHVWYWQTEDEERRRTTIASWFWCQLTVSSIIALAIAAAAGPLSQLLVGDDAAVPLLRLGAMTIPLNVCGGVVTNYFRLRRRAVATLLYSVASNLLLIALTVYYILVQGKGLPGFFLAQIAAGVATTIAGIWILKAVIAPRLASAKQLREMLPYAMPLVPAALGFWALGFSDRLFVEKLVSTKQVAVYQFAATLASAVAMITGAFTMAWGPFALSLQRKPEAANLYGRMLPLYLAGGGTVVAGLALFAPEATRLLAPASYSGAAPVAALLALGVLINGLSYIAGTGLSFARKSSPITAAVTIAAGVSLCLNSLLIPSFGITGAAWAAVGAWTAYTAYMFWQAQKVHPLPYQFWRAVLLALVLVVTVLAAPRFSVTNPILSFFVKTFLTCTFAAVALCISAPGWIGILRRRRVSAA